MAAALVINVACSDDEPAPDNSPKVEGEWVLTSATLVDGNKQTAEPDALTITNYPASPIAVNDIPNTSTIVGGVLAGAACDDPVNNSAGFYLELAADGGLNFYCPVEDAVQSEGSWALQAESDGSYTLSLSIDIEGQGLTVDVDNIVVAADGSTMSGQADGFPVPVDILQPIGLTNLQFIIVDLVLSAK